MVTTWSSTPFTVAPTNETPVSVSFTCTIFNHIKLTKETGIISTISFIKIHITPIL
jgi:hypothetical protein